MSPRLTLLLALLAACGSTPPRGAVSAASPPSAQASAQAAAPALDPPPPALRLPRNFVPTSYRARLALDPAKDGFTGSIEISGEVRERSKGFWLHGHGLKVSSARLIRGDRAIRVEVAAPSEDLLSLHPAEPVDPGPVSIAIEYTGAFDLVTGQGAYRRAFDGVPYIETQFESILARRVFPCVDEPDNKVSWQLTLDVPRDLVAVSNTASTGETALDATTRRVTFALKGRAAGARWSAETSARTAQLREDDFAVPYPYDKLDQISRPDVGGGAMENAGLITYGGHLILRDPAHITPSERFSWVLVAAHELAHQWFGDLVTTAWWDDIWLNEGFASWLEAKIVAQFDPSWRPDLLDTATRERALRADSAVTARRVRQPIVGVGDIFAAFDGITYDKGATLLAMFERALGPEKFRDGVRAYLAKHRFGSATSADFVAAISQATGRDVGPAFGSFLDQPGAPVVRAELRCAAGAPPKLALAQHRYVPPGSAAPEPGTPWHIPVCVAYERGGARAETCTELTAPSAELALDTPTCPAWVFANAGARGYYRISQPDAQLSALRDRGWKALTPAERMVVAGDVSAFAATGELDIGLELSLVPRLLAEHNRVATRHAVDIAERARGLLTGAPRARFDDWIRSVFGPIARELGWQLRPRDDIDAEQARADVVSLVAWSGDVGLRSAAVALARSWRTLPSANRGAILEIAADSDRATFERLLAAAPVEPDLELRGDLLRAVSQVTDERRLRAALALALDPRIEARETVSLVFAGQDRPQIRVVDAYFREHLAELLARFPDIGAGRLVGVAGAFLRSCDPAQRPDAAAFVRERFGKMPGAERAIARGLERFDQCVAARDLLGPRLAAWLARR